MKTVTIAAGMVCALGAGAQQGTTGGDGPLSRFEVELNGTRSYFVDAGGQPVSQESDFSTDATVFVPQAWEDSSFDRLEAGPNEARSEFDAFVESDTTLLSGGLDISANAFSDFNASGSSARLFHELNISVQDLGVFGDVLVTLDGSAGLNGFGRSTLTYVFRSDEFVRRGALRDDQSDGFSVLFEDVNIENLDISFIARTEAGTDSPVTNSQANLSVNWSVEIIPIPSPGTAVGLLAAAGLAVRRRR